MKFLLNIFIIFLLTIVVLVGGYFYLDYNGKIDKHIQKQINDVIFSFTKEQNSIIETKLEKLKKQVLSSDTMQKQIVINVENEKKINIKDIIFSLKPNFYEVNIIANKKNKKLYIPSFNNKLILPFVDKTFILRKKNKNCSYRILYQSKNLNITVLKILDNKFLQTNMNNMNVQNILYKPIKLISFTSEDNNIVEMGFISYKIKNEFNYKFFNSYEVTGITNKNKVFAAVNDSGVIGIVMPFKNKNILINKKYFNNLCVDLNDKNILVYTDFLVNENLIVFNVLSEMNKMFIGKKIKRINNHEINNIEEYKNLLQYYILQKKEIEFNLDESIIKLNKKMIYFSPNKLLKKIFGFELNDKNIISTDLKKNLFESLNLNDFQLLEFNENKILDFEDIISLVYYNFNFNIERLKLQKNNLILNLENK